MYIPIPVLVALCSLFCFIIGVVFGVVCANSID
nr:MAG TPA: Stem cell factor [Caudoviricetes sp.]